VVAFCAAAKDILERRVARHGCSGARRLLLLLLLRRRAAAGEGCHRERLQSMMEEGWVPIAS
jgi:hypothetical protein